MKNVAFAVGNFVYGIIYPPLEKLGYTQPVHPILVHITIGTIVAAFLFDYIGWIFNRPVLFQTARHSIILAFPAYIFTGLAGLADWTRRYGIASLNPHSNFIAFSFGMKFLLSGVLLILFVVMALVFPRTKPRSKARHLLYLLALLCTIGIGFYGGNIIYH